MKGGHADTSQREDVNYRIALVHNPPHVADKALPNSSSVSCKLSRLRAASALNQTDPADLLAVLDQWDEIASGGAQPAVLERSPSLRTALLASQDSAAEASCLNFVESGRLFARDLGIAPGQQSLVVNGRVGIRYSKLFMKDVTH
jgi:UDP-glucose:glycoprotein glucosyltransferase